MEVETLEKMSMILKTTNNNNQMNLLSARCPTQRSQKPAVSSHQQARGE